MPAKLTQDQVEEVVRLYQEGVFYKDIAKRFGITDNRVSQIKKERGLRSQIDIQKEKDAETARDMYCKGYQVKEIANFIGRSRNWLSKILREQGFEIAHGSVARRTIRKNIFDPFDDSAQYWLGFLAADGNLPKKAPKNIRICTGLDPDHIRKFVRWSGAPGDLSIYEYKEEDKPKNGSHYVYDKSITSRESRQFLEDFGLTPSKSKTLSLKYLTFSILRGIIDGDGSVNQTSKNGVCLSIGTASEVFADQIVSFLKEFSIESKKTPISNRSYFSIDIRRKNLIRDIFHRMYVDPNPTYYLERKRKAFLPALEACSIYDMV